MTVTVQKYFRGKPLNRPFQMQVDRATRLKDTHQNGATYYEIMSKDTAVAPVDVPQKKRDVVGIKDLNVKDALAVIKEEQSIEVLSAWLVEELATGKRQTILRVLQKAIS